MRINLENPESFKRNLIYKERDQSLTDFDWGLGEGQGLSRGLYIPKIGPNKKKLWIREG